MIEEIIRGLQATMSTQLAYSYYRTIDKSEVDFVVESGSVVLPFEIKLNSMVNRRSLRGLQLFMQDVKSDYGIVINRGKRVELLTGRIVQIPVQYI